MNNTTTSRSTAARFVALVAAGLTASAMVLSAPADAWAAEDAHDSAHADSEHAVHGNDHGADDHGGGEHGADHAMEVNWIYGVLGESDEVDEPSLLWRKPGMPVPLGAQILNSLILFYVLYRFGKKAVVDGLTSRREGIMRGIESASKMKSEAKGQLAEYEAKLAKIDSEIERVRREMREAAEAERVSILEEAKKRRERMEREAKLLIDQELKAAREELVHETVAKAMESAEQLVSQKVSGDDHRRLSDEYLASLQNSITRTGMARVQRTGGAQ